MQRKDMRKDLKDAIKKQVKDICHDQLLEKIKERSERHELASNVVINILNGILTMQSNDEEEVKKIISNAREKEAIELNDTEKEAVLLLVALRFDGINALIKMGIEITEDDDKQAIEDLVMEQIKFWHDFEADMGLKSAQMHDHFRGDINRRYAISENKIEQLRNNAEALKRQLAELDKKHKEHRDIRAAQERQFTDVQRQEWIEKSQWAAEIKEIQSTIKRLNSIFVPGGKDKAKKINTALQHAIDEALHEQVLDKESSFHNFSEFMQFTQKPDLYFLMRYQPSLKNAPSLQEALAIKRHPTFDKLFNKFLPKSFNSAVLDGKRQEWIKTSDFKANIEKIQQSIRRLDSFFVWGGKEKAAKIKAALNNAIDAARSGTIFNQFSDFLNYVNKSSKVFSNVSLNEALSIHRHPTFDGVIGKKETKSKSKLSK